MDKAQAMVGRPPSLRTPAPSPAPLPPPLLSGALFPLMGGWGATGSAEGWEGRVEREKAAAFRLLRGFPTKETHR